MNNHSIYPSVTILGSTGSVGEQTVDVALQNGITVNAISANRNVERIEAQARKFGVKAHKRKETVPKRGRDHCDIIL